MGVLMIRAGEHPSDPPRSLVVLESEVEIYERRGFFRVVSDPYPPSDDARPPRPRFNPLKFLSGSTGE